MHRSFLALVVVGGLASVVSGANLGIVPKKLIVLDKTVVGQAKVVYVSKDQVAGIDKGLGTDVGDIAATFELAYGNGSAAGAFVVPGGASDGTAGWVVNRGTVAKYVNKQAPGGPTQVKVAVVKPGKLLKLVGKGLGDEPIDVIAGGNPGPEGVLSAYCITNAGEEHCHCSHLTGCAFSPVAGGSGAKLVCKAGTGDPACGAHVTTTTTTTTSTTLQAVGSLACCQGTGECIDSPGFSLHFNTAQYCGAFLPGSGVVTGGVCQGDGTCAVQSFGPATLCCQLTGSCYESAAPVTNTSDVWWFRNQCTGAQFGTVYVATCGEDGACTAE